MPRLVLAGPLLCAVLAGCAGPRPASPASAAIEIPANWRNGQTGTGPAIDAAWWNGFGDPVLGQLEARALANNPDLAAAAARIEEARAQFRLARAQLLPQIGAVDPVTGGQALSPFGTASDTISTQPSLQVSYDLDLFGRLKLASRAAQAQLLATAAARDTVRLALVSSVAAGYITLRGLDQRLAIARATALGRAEALRIARRRAETGYTSALELHQAEAEYAASQQLIAQAELAITRQENALSLLLGENPGAIPRGVSIDRLAAPAIPDGLPADVLRRRPDVFQAEQTLVATDRSLDSARAAFLPNITLTGSAGVVLSSALGNPVGVFALGGSVLAPLFSGGRLEAQQDVAAARRDQAAYAYRKTALVAFREVEDSLASVTRTGQQQVALETQRQALTAALNNATNRYRAGYSPYLEQLDAQRGLLSAELALVQTRIDRLNAFVSLYQTLGGGWALADVCRKIDDPCP